MEAQYLLDKASKVSDKVALASFIQYFLLLLLHIFMYAPHSFTFIHFRSRPRLSIIPSFIHIYPLICSFLHLSTFYPLIHSYLSTHSFILSFIHFLSTHFFSNSRIWNHSRNYFLTVSDTQTVIILLTQPNEPTYATLMILLTQP